MVVDPRELDLELLGRHRGDSHHTHAARLGDFDHDVSAVGEGDEGELDP